VPVLVVTLTRPGREARALAGFVFLIACVTDFLDGWLARRRASTTALGQVLDPLADKLIVAAVLIMLAAQPLEPRVPAWMVVVIVLREIAVTGLRGLASTGGVLVPAQELGKYKTIFQMFAIEALLLHYRYPIPGTPWSIDFHAGGMLLDGPRPRRLVGRGLPRPHSAPRPARLMVGWTVESRGSPKCDLGGGTNTFVRSTPAPTTEHSCTPHLRCSCRWTELSTPRRLFDEAVPRGPRRLNLPLAPRMSFARTASCTGKGSRTARSLVDTA